MINILKHKFYFFTNIAFNIFSSDKLDLASFRDAISTALDWQTPTLSTGWTQFDTGAIPTTSGGVYRYPRFAKDVGGVVHIQGLAKNNSGSSNSGSTRATLFTLPAGYRPGHTLRLAAIGYNTTDYAVPIDIQPSGVVALSGSPSTIASGQYVSLNGLSFVAEQ